VSRNSAYASPRHNARAAVSRSDATAGRSASSACRPSSTSRSNRAASIASGSSRSRYPGAWVTINPSAPAVAGSSASRSRDT
jgi:hypothetical protein